MYKNKNAPLTIIHELSNQLHSWVFLYNSEERDHHRTLINKTEAKIFIIKPFNHESKIVKFVKLKLPIVCLVISKYFDNCIVSCAIHTKNVTKKWQEYLLIHDHNQLLIKIFSVNTLSSY